MSKLKRNPACALRADAASSIASAIERPSTNWRPSSWMARTVAATTVCAPSRLSRPASLSASGRNFFDSAMALADRLLTEEFGIDPQVTAAAVVVYWLGSHYLYYYVREPFMAHVAELGVAYEETILAWFDTIPREQERRQAERDLKAVRPVQGVSPPADSASA